MGEYNNMKRVQIPAFGNWEHCDEMPITQYFESAMQAGLIRGHFAEDADLFKIPVAPLKPATNSHYSHPHHHSSHNHRKGKKSVGEQQQVKKQGRVYDLTPQSHSPKKPSSKVPKAVDEDLYKIPPELLYQKPRRAGGDLYLVRAEEIAEEFVVRMPGPQLMRCMRASTSRGGRKRELLSLINV